MEFPPPFGPHAWDKLRDYLAGLLGSLPERPRAFLVVTAHWEAGQPTVSVNPKPGMLYDYYGFPPHTYELQYPAPGAPEIAAKVKGLIEKAGLPVASDGERGFDHGVFVPFLIIDPKAEIPVVMLSLRRDLDPKFHIALGKALAPLRDEGIAIVGSGMSYHDLRHFFDGGEGASATFDAWLDETAKAAPEEREARLAAWDKAPAARACHPREEHLLPLMVVAGAAGDSQGTHDFRDVIAGNTISAFRFG
jgi:aromatic ring-opening dioxygenase catalytic subunit (LigB family)